MMPTALEPLVALPTQWKWIIEYLHNQILKMKLTFNTFNIFELIVYYLLPRVFNISRYNFMSHS